MQDFLPAAMADGVFAHASEGIEVRLGLKLEGPDGGEWVVELAGGEISVTEAARDETSLTIIQSVDDWRGALWEGRGGVFGTQAGAIFRGGAIVGRGGRVDADRDGRSSLPMPGASLLNAAVIRQLAALDGLIEIVVTDGPGGDWSTGFKLGPGAIPDEPRTKISISEEDAAAIRSGSLEPMAAFMGGRIHVMGDMTLMLQMQAISMAAAAGQG